jgi:hypothetical protein
MTQQRLETYVRRAGLVGMGVLALGLPLPWLTDLANTSYLFTLAIVTAVAILCSLAHSGADRTLFLLIFGLGMVVRYYAHFVVYSWAVAGGGPFLNPDSSTYLHRSLFLAADNLRHELSPALFFGTYDCAHYYLFAALIRYVGADLYGLQTFNSGMTALTGALVFGGLRVMLPRYALPIGVMVALSPSLISFGITDLLKDPSVIVATTLALWAIAHLTQVKRPAAIAVFVVVAALALSYTRMSRFYVVPFIAVAFIVSALVLRWLNGRTAMSVFRPPRVVAAIAVIFVIAEMVPMRLGWPVSGAMVAGQVLQTIDTPAMRVYAKGMLDRMSPGPAEAVAAPSSIPPRSVNDIMQAFHSGKRAPSALAQAEKAEQARIKKPSPPAAEPAARTLPSKVLRMSVNGFRKLFGPFPWVLPPSWDPELILTGDYLLFPGMLMWYAVLPLGLAGLIGVAWRTVVQRTPESLPILIASATLVLFFSQYLVLNLSWRQREFLFPFLAVLACVAIERWWGISQFRRAYGAYWVLLVAVATVHLIARAVLV